MPGGDAKIEQGVLGFRRQGMNLNLTIAGGQAMVKQIPLSKFIVMVERMHEPDHSTVLLKNFTDADDRNPAKGQTLGRINAAHSAITLVHGVTGRMIRTPSDIARLENYYIDRRDLTAFYLAAKRQISTQDTLDELIAAFDGWKSFNIPLNPLDPHAKPKTEMKAPAARAPGGGSGEE